MKKYENMDNFHRRIHTIQVTLQMGEHKGRIAYKVGGNCFGASLLESPFEYHGQTDIKNYVINDCNLAYNEDYECFTGVLKDEEGNGLECDWTVEDINDCVVAIEIIDCVIDKPNRPAKPGASGVMSEG